MNYDIGFQKFLCTGEVLAADSLRLDGCLEFELLQGALRKPLEKELRLKTSSNLDFRFVFLWEIFNVAISF